MTRRALVVIPQDPFDTASGAAISTRTTADFLAGAGWRVRVVGTTAGEGLDSSISSVALDPALSLPRPISRREKRGVKYALLEVGMLSIDEARRQLVESFDRLVAHEAQVDPPDIVLTYGSSEAEVARRLRLREQGARVVFTVHNVAYHHARSFAATDAILTPSVFLSDHYRKTHGVDPTALPPPVWVEDVVAPVRRPTFFTFVNPSLEKGLVLFLRIVELCASRCPDLQFLAVESRGSSGLIRQVAGLLGIGAESLRNLHIARSTSNPASLYAVTKVLLVPSAVPEGAGRVVVEAQLNSIPVVASDRGGLPETVGSGGFILPAHAAPDDTAVSGTTAAWADLVGRLDGDESFFRAATRAACAAAEPHRLGAVRTACTEFYSQVLEDKPPRPTRSNNSSRTPTSPT